MTSQFPSPSRNSAIEPQTLAAFCARILEDKGAEDILVLDVSHSSQLADCFIVSTVESSRQLRAIAETLRTAASIHRLPKGSVEGQDSGRWLLVDLYDVIVHVFDPEARKYYDLELLWGDSPHVDWKPIETPPVPKEVRTRPSRALRTAPQLPE